MADAVARVNFNLQEDKRKSLTKQISGLLTVLRRMVKDYSGFCEIIKKLMKTTRKSNKEKYLGNILLQNHVSVKSGAIKSKEKQV